MTRVVAEVFFVLTKNSQSTILFFVNVFIKTQGGHVYAKNHRKHS